MLSAVATAALNLLQHYLITCQMPDSSPSFHSLAFGGAEILMTTQCLRLGLKQQEQQLINHLLTSFTLFALFSGRLMEPIQPISHCCLPALHTNMKVIMRGVWRKTVTINLIFYCASHMLIVVSPFNLKQIIVLMIVECQK